MAFKVSAAHHRLPSHRATSLWYHSRNKAKYSTSISAPSLKVNLKSTMPPSTKTHEFHFSNPKKHKEAKFREVLNKSGTAVSHRQNPTHDSFDTDIPLKFPLEEKNHSDVQNETRELFYPYRPRQMRKVRFSDRAIKNMTPSSVYEEEDSKLIKEAANEMDKVLKQNLEELELKPVKQKLYDFEQRLQKIEQKIQRLVVENENFIKLPTKRTYNMLSFEKFKQMKVESFEEYLKSPYVLAIPNRNLEETKKAYENYCRSKYVSYRQSFYGGNPTKMI